ncbi:hypothetical protein [Streptomyces sp. NPDC002054]|uniref:hypothetical protein n=1 Tax=Streptomyces sp. NPDC002054 TaxID=3154663 RepID=UPI0033313F1C
MNDVSYAVLDGAYWAEPHDEECPRCAVVRSAGTGTNEGATGGGEGPPGTVPADPGEAGTGGTDTGGTDTGGADADGTDTGPAAPGRPAAARWVDSLQDALVDTDHPGLRTALLFGSVTTVLAGAAATATRWS